MQWLDLSFNQISKIEGLDSLTQLTDLSLFSNRITASAFGASGGASGRVGLLASGRLAGGSPGGARCLSRMPQAAPLFPSDFEPPLCLPAQELEGMEALTNLVSVSIGNNGIKSLDNVKYLRRFSSLRLVNLSGNPICKARY